MDTIRTNIENRIIPILDKAGMYYRIFSRVKSTSSINRKLSKKAIEYREKGKKMQDIIGIRIIFYFKKMLIFSTKNSNAWKDMIRIMSQIH